MVSITIPPSDLRHRQLLHMLKKDPTKYAYICDGKPRKGYVVLGMAIRGVATFDIRITQESFDPLKFLEIIDG